MSMHLAWNMTEAPPRAAAEVIGQTMYIYFCQCAMLAHVQLCTVLSLYKMSVEARLCSTHSLEHFIPCIKCVLSS